MEKAPLLGDLLYYILPAELEKMRKDRQEGHMQTLLSLTRVETAFKGLINEVKNLEKRTVEGRSSANEDTNGMSRSCGICCSVTCI